MAKVLSRREAALLQVEAEIQRRKEIAQCARFAEFVRAAWPIVEPVAKYIHGRHVEVICEHLERLVDDLGRTEQEGGLKNLVINIPPGTSKSTIASVMFAAWVWGPKGLPHLQLLYGSYPGGPGLEQSMACRNLIRSEWYQKRWGKKFALKSDQNEKDFFANDKGGWRQALAPPAGTGKHADIVIYDDPNNVKEVESDTIREGVNHWHDQVMFTRVNDMRRSARVGVQQRCHERDWSGHVAEKGGWKFLVIPMEWDGENRSTTGFEDWRTEIGELLCPERVGPEELLQLKSALGPQASAQLQQRPTAVEGGKFKRQYWRYWNFPEAAQNGKLPPVVVRLGPREIYEAPQIPLPERFEQVLHSWDMTFKDTKGTDYVAGGVWGRVGADCFLIDVAHERMDMVKTLASFRDMNERYPCPEKLVEDKANGPAVISLLKHEIPGIVAVTPQGGKASRANAVIPYVQAGNVYIPNPTLYPWVNEYIEEHALFPGKHDDYVDMTSQALVRLMECVADAAAPEFRVKPRAGDPATASHIVPAHEMERLIDPKWRRYIAVAPGNPGCVAWICETPTGSLRIYRELDVSGLDAFQCGRKIAEHSAPDAAQVASPRTTEMHVTEVLLDKRYFRAAEPVGSFAALVEEGIRDFRSHEQRYEDRTATDEALRSVVFTARAVDIDRDSVWERLRDMLRFAPPATGAVTFDRREAFMIARRDVTEYNRYMDAVEGIIRGEWPKLKISDACPNIISALGSARRGQKEGGPFLDVVLIGASAPRSFWPMSNEQAPSLLAQVLKRGLSRAA